ncbi:MAG: hypothetical protein KGY50_04870, partial [Candidatus Thermoplasmatota archaeon]|nr:hypothetical protein [Candidatus Thermoplasmatota archaeon]
LAVLLLLPVCYVLLRVLFFMFSWPFAAQIGFWGAVGITVFFTLFLLYRLTNKFKTLLSMNSMRRKRGGKK